MYLFAVSEAFLNESPTALPTVERRVKFVSVFPSSNRVAERDLRSKPKRPVLRPLSRAGQYGCATLSLQWALGMGHYQSKKAPFMMAVHDKPVPSLDFRYWVTSYLPAKMGTASMSSCLEVLLPNSPGMTLFTPSFMAMSMILFCVLTSLAGSKITMPCWPLNAACNWSSG